LLFIYNSVVDLAQHPNDSSLVGASLAKGIALGRNIPLAAVNHIESHLLAILLEQEVQFPFIALVVSGGHTHLYEVKGVGEYRTLGQTIDDAAGEAFDKVAKLLGIPYPGGLSLTVGKGW
jgi:N6-L-threonylcarbamoyladenine synthase